MKNVDLLVLLENVKREYEEMGATFTPAYKEVITAIDTAKEEMRKEDNKGNGKVKLADAMNKVIKAAAGNKALEGCFPCEDYTVVCDGHMIIATKEKVNLKPIPDDCKPFNVKPFISEMLNSLDDSKMDSFVSPSIAEIKNAVKVGKAKMNIRKNERIPFEMVPDRLYANSDFIQLAIMATGNQNYKNNTSKSCLVFANEERTTLCMVLPINASGKERVYRVVA